MMSHGYKKGINLDKHEIHRLGQKQKQIVQDQIFREESEFYNPQAFKYEYDDMDFELKYGHAPVRQRSNTAWESVQEKMNQDIDFITDRANADMRILQNKANKDIKTSIDWANKDLEKMGFKQDGKNNNGGNRIAY